MTADKRSASNSKKNSVCSDNEDGGGDTDNPRTVSPERQELQRDTSSVSYSCVKIIQETHQKQVYAVEVNTQVQCDGILFATVGSNSIQIYKLDSNDKTQLIHAYLDPDPEESFYSCSWTLIDSNSNSNRAVVTSTTTTPTTTAAAAAVAKQQPSVILAAGGKRGVIRIIDVTKKSKSKFFHHTGAVNHLVFSKAKPHILCTASTNCTVALWDVKLFVCLVVFHGPDGHNNEVLAVDMNDKFTMLASAGMDSVINVWSLTKSKIQKQIQLGDNQKLNSNQKRLIKPYEMSFPDIKATSIHDHYIDCIQFYDNFIISKCADHSFSIWQPCLPNNQTTKQPHLLLKWSYSQKEKLIWFIKFDISFAEQLLAVGSSDGIITLWDLKSKENFNTKYVRLKHPESKEKN